MQGPFEVQPAREEQSFTQKQRGGIGYVLLWILGVPIPVLILISLLRGCA
ncbi:MAG TPA: hypothetical protein VFG49_05550 [Dyella sp.]|nr:hypothetical protein [Dyella sp.]HET6552987.1 hypothetical protein [Dyella sp.]